MTHEDKLTWMAVWASKNHFQLELEGEVGICRECVGILSDGKYPDYHWYDNDYNQIDENGEVWTPENAYHKHNCVAVLGRGKEAEEELYEWIKWFDDNHFKLETGDNPVNKELGALAFILGQHRYARMVRKEA